MPQFYEHASENKHEKPRISATTLLILEREGSEVQVFVLKRQNRAGFLKDVLVFPGGVVEETDFDHTKDLELARKNAALREIKEETGLVLSDAALLPFSWWLTPVVEKRRFDTRFYLARYPKDQVPVMNRDEAEWGALLTPSAILALHQQNEIRLLPPTLLTLETISHLQRFEQVAEKALCLGAPICPALEQNPDGSLALVIPAMLDVPRHRFEMPS